MLAKFEVKQIKPARAEHISGYKPEWQKELYENEIVIGQPKYDGARMLIHFNNGEVACTSRRISKKTNRYMQNEDKLPMLHEIAKTFSIKGYTVLDCEAYSKDWNSAIGILHSLPERAIELQKENTLYFAIFDCLWYDGNDISELSYVERLKYAKQAILAANYEPLHLTEFVTNDLSFGPIGDVKIFNSINEQKQALKIAVDKGFEGIMIKSLTRKYNDKGASLKCKRFETVDVVVYDYRLGNGKYSDTVGALLVGYYDPSTKNVVHISRVNCSTNKVRDMWRDNWESLKYSVLEVECQELTDISLRNPVYQRIRKDKDFTMCTRESIFGESK